MPQAIPVPIREKIVKLKKRGKTIEAIAEQLELSFSTVRQIWRRYRDKGEEGLAINYQCCGRRGIRSPQFVSKQAIKLRTEHPKWGAGLIRVVMQQKWPDLQIPSERTLQRWFLAQGLSKRKNRYLTQNRTRANSVHEVWQMDAKERVALADKSQSSWMTITDERSGAIIASVIFPPRDMGEGRS